MTEFNFPITSPEAQGIRSTAIRHFVDAVEEINLELHSFMLIRHGVKIAQGWWKPYQAEYPHMLFSLSKSFASSAVGLAVSEGRLSTSDRVVSFFPDDLPNPVSDHLAEMRISHLLSMSTGHAEDTTGRIVNRPDGNWVKGFLSLPVEHMPGAPFVYNSGASYMLSAIIQKVTGQRILDYMKPRLFDALGIQNPTWDSCPRGINIGGWGLSIRTEDIARFGQMYLQKGSWLGKQILPVQWVEEATSAQVANEGNPNIDWVQGYGYQFWRCRHGAYRGDGAFGQFCLIMPDQDAVIAITSGVSDMQAVLNLIWKYLLPEMKFSPLPENRPAFHKMQEKLGCLALPEMESKKAPVTREISPAKKYRLDENSLNVNSIEFETVDHRLVVSTTGDKQVHKVIVGENCFLMSESGILDDRARKNTIAGKGVWEEPGKLVITLRFVHTPFCLEMHCQFEKDRVEINVVRNVSFEPTLTTRLVGMLAESDS
jgi:hypothetical protein